MQTKSFRYDGGSQLLIELCNVAATRGEPCVCVGALGYVIAPEHLGPMTPSYLGPVEVIACDFRTVRFSLRSEEGHVESILK